MTRLRALFRRYVERYLRLTCPGQALPDGAGHIDRVTVCGGKVVVEGWTTAGSVVLSGPAGRVAAMADLPRVDVAERLGHRADVGFRVEIPWHPGALALALGAEGAPVPLRPVRRRRLLMAQAWLLPRFCRDLLRAAPHLLPALLAGNPAARANVKRCLGLGDLTIPVSLETRIFERHGLPAGPAPVPVTIVLPVHNAFDLLTEALRRVVAHTDLPWHLVLIEDASTDPRVRPYLRDWAAARPGQVTLLENAKNLGFIGSVNRGFAVALSRGGHVVLLNSDALVPENWAARLLRPILRHENVASVTPMSNDATILSVPRICAAAALPPGTGDAVDAVARRFNPEAGLAVLPTGVGFCMAISIAYLRRLPSFDPAFGRGYGEEVDWCQRARALGGRHLGLPGLFVEHRGGGSFGSAAKQALTRRNDRIVAARYPRFDAEVQRFVATDPMVTPRLALGIALAAVGARRPVPVYVAHSLGGGAEIWLRDRIAGDLLGGPAALVLRLGGARRWRLELHTEQGVTAGETDDLAFVRRLLAPLSVRDLVYSCAVGDRDPAGVPEAILSLRRPGDRLEVLFHDYFPLSPSHTLTGSDGLYRGDVGPECRDRAHSALRPDGTPVSLAGWRAAWGRLVAAADALTVFSEDSRDHVLRVYPAAAGRLRVAPHRLPHAVGRVTAPQGRGEVIGVLGNIGRHKGAGVVQALAARGAVRMVVIGNVDPAHPLPAQVPVTGTYRPEEIAGLARAHGVTRWLIPSVWPETFSYTTHEALATGLPVHAFHIGAQGAAVARAPNGVAMHFDPEADLAALVLASLPACPERAAA